MTIEKKLADLQPGDKVIFSVRRRREVRTIKRLTNTRIILEFTKFDGGTYERQFEKKNGYEWGNSSGYDHPRIVIYTPEEEYDIMMEAKRDKIYGFTFRLERNAPHDLINEVYDFLTEKGFLK